MPEFELKKMKSRKRILVAPLNRGLGHAARCMPIVNKLLGYGVEVFIAADGRSLDFLRREFPNLTHIRLPEYIGQYLYDDILPWIVLKKFPAMQKHISEEHNTLETIVKQFAIDAVISDSRLGVYSSAVPSIFIIHQLNILLPNYLHWTEEVITSVIRKRCGQFTECWIPDSEGAGSLAGRLSHPKTLPRNAYYIGPLTRLISIDAKKEMDVLVLLSGQEPERTQFEQIVVTQLQQTKLNSIVVRGKPEHKTRIKFAENIIMINSLQTEELSKAISISHIIVSRPGYSTLMDLSCAGARAIFVPIPRQTEQEYFAEELKRKKICYSETQDEFSLQRSLEKAKEYSGFVQHTVEQTVLRQRIEHLLNMIGY
jgi:uncharacterized protein (TIGR00661 family)